MSLGHAKHGSASTQCLAQNWHIRLFFFKEYIEIAVNLKVVT